MTNRELAAVREVRNRDICQDYLTGLSVRQLSEKFDMSTDSIRRILRESLPEGAVLETVKRTTNICFDCAKACGGCSWSKRFEPVPGWTAEPVVIKSFETLLGGPKFTKTFHITACPQFERG